VPRRNEEARTERLEGQGHRLLEVGPRRRRSRRCDRAGRYAQPGPGDASRVPADVGDGRNDDVVARQIREAAMAEEDPKIREKLWDEYRRYKRGES
jgi:hypothetical protein